MCVPEYLLSYGKLGDFGRFYSVRPLTCRRGDRAVVLSHRGVELATVLCEVTPGHARHLPNTTVGQLLRLATPQDEATADQLRARGQCIFEDARSRIAELALPLEVIDVEVLLDGQTAYLHHIRWAECDVRPFVSALSTRHELQIGLEDLGRLGHPEPEGHGCGRPDCGRTEGGGCSTCGSGGCGTCGSATPEAMRAYFAERREKMSAGRTPLL